MIGGEGIAALRVLRDCGAVRVRFYSMGLDELSLHNAAEVRPVDGDEDALDYRITMAGRVLADVLLS